MKSKCHIKTYMKILYKACDEVLDWYIVIPIFIYYIFSYTICHKDVMSLLCHFNVVYSSNQTFSGGLLWRLAQNENGVFIKYKFYIIIIYTHVTIRLNGQKGDLWQRKRSSYQCIWKCVFEFFFILFFPSIWYLTISILLTSWNTPFPKNFIFSFECNCVEGLTMAFVQK